MARILELPSGARIDENAALLVARREDIKLILAGSIAAAGSGYSLTVRAVNPTAEAGQSEVASASAQAGTKDEVLAAVASLAADLRRDLGDTDEEIAKTAAADSFTTNSMEAMQAYGLAQQMQATGRRAESLEAFIRAIEHDPQFGLAYSGAAVASNALGRTPEAQQYWKTMLTHLDRMSEREKYRALGAYYLGSRPQLTLRRSTPTSCWSASIRPTATGARILRWHTSGPSICSKRAKRPSRRLISTPGTC